MIPVCNILVERSTKVKFMIIKIIVWYLLVQWHQYQSFLLLCKLVKKIEICSLQRSNVLLYYSKFVWLPISKQTLVCTCLKRITICHKHRGRTINMLFTPGKLQGQRFVLRCFVVVADSRGLIRSLTFCDKLKQIFAYQKSSWFL